MDLALLPSIILAIAEQRALDTLLATIVKIVSSQPDVALARLWLIESEITCPDCRGSSEERALHLRASAGNPRNRDADWSRTNGTFHKIPLNTGLKLSHVASTGEAIRIPKLSKDRHWIRDPEWARREDLAGFAAHPLVFRGETLGVLAVFRRVKLEDECWRWLGTLANAAAVAVANARAFEEAESLRRQLEQERDYLREEVRTTGDFGEIVGSSPALERVMRQVRIVASTGANVLVLGESGTGKELIARAIHERSPRARQALVKVNCGSIPRELFESEFFGHVRGSFTGAVRDRVGRFQLADGGTLFLDEVGEIPLELQAKLLRVLQEGEFERVGDDSTRRVDVRVVAATNRDLKTEVDAGRFRLDLYYRLAIFPLEVPPLRDRRDDIPELAAHFIRRACQKFHLPEPRLTQRQLTRAQDYDWPGNIRELQNVMERALILSPSGAALEFDLPNTVREKPSPRIVHDEVVPETEWRRRERANLLTALTQADGKVSGPGGAAELLQINPATLASRLKVHGIHKQTIVSEPPESRSPGHRRPSSR